MNYRKQNNVVWHKAKVTRQHREALNGHRGVVIWFTGLPASGKSTIAHALEEELYKKKCRTYVFDGDNVRHGLCSDLGFSKEDRAENIRRIGEMVKLFVDAGIIALVAFISPFKADRERVRRLLGDGNFIEVYCKCPVDVCEERDLKGNYKRAMAGEIKEFTGISSPYEEPESPEIILDTSHMTVQQCVQKILDILVRQGIVGESLV